MAALAGKLENQIVAAQIAHASMAALTASDEPGPEASNAMMCRHTIFVNAVLRAGEKAMELGGGAAFYRSVGLERCFRDLQGVRYHPIQEKAQTHLAGRFVLGLGFDS